MLIRSSLRDLSAAAAGRSRRTADQAAFLMADRIAKLSKMGPASTNAGRRRLSRTLLVLNLTVFAIRAHGALDGLARRGVAASVVAQARGALGDLDPDALRQAAAAHMSTTDLDRPASLDAIAALQVVATLTSAHRSALRRLNGFAAIRPATLSRSTASWRRRDGRPGDGVQP